MNTVQYMYLAISHVCLSYLFDHIHAALLSADSIVIATSDNMSWQNLWLFAEHWVNNVLLNYVIFSSTIKNTSKDKHQLTLTSCIH